MDVLESLDLKVKKPMTLHMDNKGAVDLCNNWQVSGRSKHVSTRLNFMRELKEQGVMEYKWVSGEDNPADLFTKNLGGPSFSKHTMTFCSDDDNV